MTIARGSANSSASGAQQTAPLTLTVPGGVPAGSVCWLMTTADLGSSGTPTMTVVSTGTTPAFVGTTNYVPTGCVSNLYWFVSTLADQGATISMTPNGNCYLGMSIATYTGAATTQPDVFVAGSQPTAATSYTAPNATTASAGDWGVYFASFLGGGSITGFPGTFVTQDSASRSSIVDSNGSVGNAGTVIGGGTWTGNASVPWLGFTVGMQPAGVPVPVSVSDFAGAVESLSVNKVFIINVNDFAGSIEARIILNISGRNLNLPVMTFMAATYEGNA